MDIKIYCVDDRVKRDSVGNKAFPLFSIAHLCNVPSFVCIESNAFRTLLERDENKELKDMLCRLIAQRDNVSERLQEISEKVMEMYIPGDVIEALEIQLASKDIHEPFAVRSSSVLEDNSYHSGAGVFESFTDIGQKDGIINYVKACWASQFSLRAWSYLKGIKSIDQLQMGVLIQNYQKALKSGVLFTVDPTNPENGMRMEIVNGNAEKYMLGELSAENTVFCVVDPKGFMLSSNENSGWQYDLFQIGDRLRRLMGYEVDVEWVYDGRQVYILQCRPVTRMIDVSGADWLKELGAITDNLIPKSSLSQNDNWDLSECAYVYETCNYCGIPTVRRYLFRYGDRSDIKRYAKAIGEEFKEERYLITQANFNPISCSTVESLENNLKNLLHKSIHKPLVVSICQDKKCEYSALSYYDPVSKYVRIEYSDKGMDQLEKGDMIPSVCITDVHGNLELWSNGNLDGENPTRGIEAWIAEVAVNTVKLYKNCIMSILKWKICQNIPYLYDYMEETRNIDNSLESFGRQHGRIGYCQEEIHGRILKISNSDIDELKKVYAENEGVFDKKAESTKVIKKIKRLKEQWECIIAVANKPYIYLKPLISIVDGMAFKEESNLCMLSAFLRRQVFPSEFIGTDYDKLQDGDWYYVRHYEW